MADIKSLKKRYEKAKHNQTKFEDVLREAYEYSNPERGIYDTLTSGRREYVLYDDTAVIGLKVYADKNTEKHDTRMEEMVYTCTG